MISVYSLFSSYMISHIYVVIKTAWTHFIFKDFDRQQQQFSVSFFRHLNYYKVKSILRTNNSFKQKK
jgi:hypothetical protein